MRKVMGKVKAVWQGIFLLISMLLVLACSHTQPIETIADTSADEAAITFNTFTGANQRLIGRFDTTSIGQARFTWPGSAVEFRFTGTEAQMALASNGRVRFQVDVDGKLSNLWVDSGDAVYSLATGLEAGEHRIRLTRITESFALVTALLSDPWVNGTLLSAPANPNKHLLVLGDSITAGYGVEGSSQACSYSVDTSNQQLTYAAIAAKTLGADLHAIAWSGIGAWRSYGEKTPVNPNILARYQRTLADDVSSQWNTAAYQPAATLITIGTNDYWEGAVSDDYRLGMANLVERVQADYPGKPIYLIMSPMLNGAVRDSQKAVLNTLASNKVTLLDLGKIESSDGLGCDYHPNIVTQQRMADLLVQHLKTDLTW